MNVLSLFDGLSCGQIALNRIGIKPEVYYAAEVDKYAIKVTQANYPKTVQLGDVTQWREWDINWASIDLLIGGSPCQGFSFAGKQLAFHDPRSKLFFVYVDILNHIKSVNPNVKFMLENVKMKKEYLAVISEHLGVEPVFINSALVSAQNRQRYYWCNWSVEQPEDRGIVLADILDGESDFDINSEGWHDWWEKNKDHQLKKKFSAVCNNGSTDKAITMTARQYASWNGNFVVKPLISQRGRGNNPGGIRAEDGKAPSMTSNSWEHNNHVVLGAARRGRGDEIRKDEKSNALLSDGHQSRWLAKGGEMYRKLTPIECERLQTVPDNYTNHVSNTQRYKMLGNGWTVDVIAHIFSQMQVPISLLSRQLDLFGEAA